MKKTLLSFFLLLNTPVVSAEHWWFGGVQFGSYEFEEHERIADFDHKAVGFLVGYMASKHIGIEVRHGTGLGSNDVKIEVSGVTEDKILDFDHYVSLYGRTEYSFKYGRIYALAGYSVNESTESVVVADEETTLTGFTDGISYGVGVGFINSDKVSFNLEYLNVIDTGIYSISGTNLSVQFVF